MLAPVHCNKGEDINFLYVIAIGLGFNRGSLTAFNKSDRVGVQGRSDGMEHSPAKNTTAFQ